MQISGRPQWTPNYNSNTIQQKSINTSQTQQPCPTDFYYNPQQIHSASTNSVWNIQQQPRSYEQSSQQKMNSVEQSHIKQI